MRKWWGRGLVFRIPLLTRFDQSPSITLWLNHLAYSWSLKRATMLLPGVLEVARMPKNCDTGPSPWSLQLRPHVNVSFTPTVMSDGVDICVLHGEIPWDRFPLFSSFLPG